MKISGWQVVPYNDYFLLVKGTLDFDTNKGELIIGDQRVKNLSKIEIDGQKYTVFYNTQHKALYLYKPENEFGRLSYQQFSPDEDWAETHAQYLFQHELLIKEQPAKFLHFQRQYHLYDQATVERAKSSYIRKYKEHRAKVQHKASKKKSKSRKTK